MPLRLISDWQACHDAALALLCNDAPAFLARIGGSDTDAVIDYLEAVEAGEPEDGLLQRIQPHVARIARFNGYYDLDGDAQNAVRFCATLLRLYERCNHLTVGGGKWLGVFFPDNVPAQFHQPVGEKLPLYHSLVARLVAAQGNVSLYPYNFVEKIVCDPWTLFRVFATALEGRRVLIVSPFSRSIMANFANRQRFFKNYAYPRFEPVTLDVPITYAGLPEARYPHRTWFTTAAALQDAVARQNFDVALLGCGSYAMPLGVFIQEELRRKAVYVGGVLQLFFGILGRRYLDPFFLDQINAEVFIRPIESDSYREQVADNESGPREAFGAYF